MTESVFISYSLIHLSIIRDISFQSGAKLQKITEISKYYVRKTLQETSNGTMNQQKPPDPIWNPAAIYILFSLIRKEDPPRLMPETTRKSAEPVIRNQEPRAVGILPAAQRRIGRQDPHMREPDYLGQDHEPDRH